MIMKILLFPFKLVKIIFKAILNFIWSIIIGVVKWFVIRAIVLSLIVLVVLYFLAPGAIPLIGDMLVSNPDPGEIENTTEETKISNNESLSNKTQTLEQKAKESLVNYLIDQALG